VTVDAVAVELTTSVQWLDIIHTIGCKHPTERYSAGPDPSIRVTNTCGWVFYTLKAQSYGLGALQKDNVKVRERKRME
jgi:hypothetical protein